VGASRRSCGRERVSGLRTAEGPLRSTVLRSNGGARLALYGKGGGAEGAIGAAVDMRVVEGGFTTAEVAVGPPPIAGGFTIASTRYVACNEINVFEHLVYVKVRGPHSVEKLVEGARENMSHQTARALAS
jgi:hypothetical protein